MGVGGEVDPKPHQQGQGWGAIGVGEGGGECVCSRNGGVCIRYRVQCALADLFIGQGHQVECALAKWVRANLDPPTSRTEALNPKQPHLKPKPQKP